MKKIRTLTGGLAVLTALTLIVSCTPPATPTGGVKTRIGGGDHAHGAGPHDGAVGDWGGGKYHIEFTVDHDKKEATVYILDSDEKTAVPIKARDDQLSLKIKGPRSGEFQVVLRAKPQQGDPAGKSSRFVGNDDKLGVEQEFEGTVNGEADGTPYTGDFKEQPAK
jgi:hypothetical protein